MRRLPLEDMDWLLKQFDSLIEPDRIMLKIVKHVWDKKRRGYASEYDYFEDVDGEIFFLEQDVDVSWHINVFEFLEKIVDLTGNLRILSEGWLYCNFKQVEDSDDFDDAIRENLRVAIADVVNDINGDISNMSATNFQALANVMTQAYRKKIVLKTFIKTGGYISDENKPTFMSDLKADHLKFIDQQVQKLVNEQRGLICIRYKLITSDVFSGHYSIHIDKYNDNIKNLSKLNFDNITLELGLLGTDYKKNLKRVKENSDHVKDMIRYIIENSRDYSIYSRYLHCYSIIVTTSNELVANFQFKPGLESKLNEL